MLVVADTTPLRYLAAIGEVGLLPGIFGKVLIPPTVWNELTAASTLQTVRLFFEARPDWLQLRSPRLDSLQVVSSHLDAGERAAIALAIEIKADLILIDEAAGRREAKELGMRITGTVGVLRLGADIIPAMISKFRIGTDGRCKSFGLAAAERSQHVTTGT
jgi:predicted nucleic acid-binding protein